MFKNLKMSFYGLYYLFIGLVLAIFVWPPYGDNIIDVLFKIIGIVILAIGLLLIIEYSFSISIFDNITKYILVSGIIKIAMGIIILSVPSKIISSILGIIYLANTIVDVVLNKEYDKILTKHFFKLVIATLLIIFGFASVALVILKIFDILLIVYGIVLIIISSIKRKRINEELNKSIFNMLNNSSSDVIDGDFTEK